ncbi:AI-2E family transporter [Roseibium sp.]|uniref:AI-2E family transporter n=1 Tax=Roseibium sp. TaxID=1936156 RepID=UPI003A988079
MQVSPDTVPRPITSIRAPLPRKGLADAMPPTAAWGIFLLLSIGAFQHAQALLVPVVAALLFGLALGQAQERLERLGILPFLAAAAILLLLVCVAIVSARVLILPFEEWSSRLPEIYAALKRQLYNVRELLLTIEDAADAVQERTGIDASGGKEPMVSAPAFLGGLAISLPAAGGQLVLFAGVLFFYLSSRSTLLSRLADLERSWAGLKPMGERVMRAEKAVSEYFSTVSLINLGLGIVTGVCLAGIGLPNAWFWGALAGLLNFIPYIGPLLLTALLLGAGLLGEGSTFDTLLPAMVFFTLNLIEANFVTPVILGRKMLIEPLFVVLSLGFWVWLWGAVGALVAVPMLLVIQAMATAPADQSRCGGKIAGE